MSDNTESCKLQSNEEIIEELTEGIKDYHVADGDTAAAAGPYQAPGSSYQSTEEAQGNVLKGPFKDSDLEEEKSSESIDLNDYIDEDALNQVNNTLTDEQKLERHKNALELKGRGNAAHKSNEYLEAVHHYTEALRICPTNNTNDRAVLYSNRAASKIQLQYKKSALDDCSKAIELNPNYVRAYLRRAKLYEELDELFESLGDYQKVLEFDKGNPEALRASVRLPPLINEHNETMKIELLTKLRDLGNMVLKPFGLSTENFNLQHDPNSGGYSVNFKQNPT